MTLSLQSLKEDVIRAINRINIKKSSFDIIKGELSQSTPLFLYGTYFRSANGDT